MFKHLLLPTDGSELSEASVRLGIELARDQGADVTVLNITPEYEYIGYGAEFVPLENIDGARLDASEEADRALDFAAGIAAEAGVACKSVRIPSNSPYLAIIKLAKESGCDLICMASHGRRGIAGLLLGSETQKVLTHSSIPVLVHRSP